MRLIDADRLRAKITAMVTRPHQFMYEIERAPTVEAIPIEWIRKWVKNWKPYTNVKSDVFYMLEDWEKENETN